jgi:hypothetical protein
MKTRQVQESVPMLRPTEERVTAIKTRTFTTETTLEGSAPEREELPSYRFEGKRLTPVGDSGTEFEVLGTGERLKVAAP